MKSKEIILNYIVEMFPEKDRHWITGPYYPFFFDSWNQWITNRPFSNVTWSSAKILLWNIRSAGEQYDLQVIYANPDGVLTSDLKGVTIRVKSSDEDAIRKWLLDQKHV